jgi:sugar transferase EpsL
MQRLIALLLIFFLSPLFLIIYILVRINFGSPVLFKQERPGKNNDIFTIFKFRTMLNLVNSSGKKLSDQERLTKFGKFLRASSLDELPELYNVVRGEMAFVGPRPLLVDYLPLYSKEQIRRHNVKPGITGFAQINGRNLISWEEKLEMDVWYVDNRSFLLDIQILFKTLLKVLRQEGISNNGHVTMPFFDGGKKRNEE